MQLSKTVHVGVLFGGRRSGDELRLPRCYRGSEMKKLAITLVLSAAAVGVATYTVSKLEKAYYGSLPAEAFYHVRKIRVENTSVGESPRVLVDRKVLKTFTGERVATLYKVSGHIRHMVCTNTTFRLFVDQSLLPAVTNLEWWMNRPTYDPCPTLGPGEYLLSLSWIIELPEFPNKIVHAESNIFTVTP
jgi:hypothetical protein